MDRIDIWKVSDDVLYHKGFDQRGCYGSLCSDSCCRRGADVDRETFGLIMQHRQVIQARLGRDLEDCFEKEWMGQDDFLGKDCIATTVIDGTCALHRRDGKGCVLFQVLSETQAPRRIVPSTCRLYPLTWNNGVIELFKGIEPTCNCLDTANGGTRKLMETQKDAIDDIFRMHC